ncbi:PucR family transcriptional regulator [Winogradskya humida]|uniref:PucR-like helix-turn-helix protein n=1 Tax=Winogradskya humida TaxID=113566 RepID=A0ABQ4A4J5_9ACTN|nr:helix-turn-helix domain-containing protein [Actinoplanes humidus]GIE25769.1 hypothetical protein Ahu01nite_088710 [Actinoplanes humidus]
MATGASRRRLIAELTAQSAPLSARILERMRAEIPLYARSEPEAFLPAVLTSLQRVLAPLHEDRPFTDGELAEFRSYGEQRARQGIPTEEMLRAWRLSIREVVDEMIAVGRQRRLAERTLLELTRDLLTTTEVATLAFTQGHHRAELELARQEQQRRTDFVRGVLSATLGPAEIRRQAGRYGLDPDLEYHPFRARPTEAMTVEAVERLLGLTLDSSRPRGLAALIDGDFAGFIDRLPKTESKAMPKAVPASAIGVGPSAALDQLEPQFRRATRALTTATAFDLTGFHDLTGLGLLPAVLADADVGDELVRRYITPLGSGEGIKPILDTVRVYLSLGMRADLAAVEMSVHHNTVRYRVRRYAELTGIDLRDPNRALEMWWALQRIRLES